METYVASVKLSVDGKDIDLVSLEEGEVVRRKPANTMHRSGTIKVVERYELTIKTLINADKTKNIDLSKVKGGTITMTYEDGSTKVYSEATGLSKGGSSFDGDKPGELTYKMVAEAPVE